jgi:hypothetical protein
VLSMFISQNFLRRNDYTHRHFDNVRYIGFILEDNLLMHYREISFLLLMFF